MLFLYAPQVSRNSIFRLVKLQAVQVRCLRRGYVGHGVRLSVRIAAFKSPIFLLTDRRAELRATLQGHLNSPRCRTPPQPWGLRTAGTHKCPRTRQPSRPWGLRTAGTHKCPRTRQPSRPWIFRAHCTPEMSPASSPKPYHPAAQPTPDRNLLYGPVDLRAWPGSGVAPQGPRPHPDDTTQGATDPSANHSPSQTPSIGDRRREGDRKCPRRLTDFAESLHPIALVWDWCTSAQHPAFARRRGHGQDRRGDGRGGRCVPTLWGRGRNVGGGRHDRRVRNRRGGHAGCVLS